MHGLNCPVQCTLCTHSTSLCNVLDARTQLPCTMYFVYVLNCPVRCTWCTHRTGPYNALGERTQLPCTMYVACVHKKEQCSWCMYSPARYIVLGVSKKCLRERGPYFLRSRFSF